MKIIERRHRDYVGAYQRNRSAPQGFRRLFNTVKDIMRYKEGLATMNMQNLVAALNQNKVYEGSGRLNASRYAARQHHTLQHTVAHTIH